MKKKQFVQNEWNRILVRCDDRREVKKSRKVFLAKLSNNDYPSHLVKQWTKSFIKQPQRVYDDKKIFYMSVPFINDNVNNMVKRSLRHLGITVRLSHKSNKLQSRILPAFKKLPQKCKLANCLLKDHNCFKSMVVYEWKCQCGETYIGSTERHLHIRIKEHCLIQQNSAVFLHRLGCVNGKWTTRILANGVDITDLRLKEAILISNLHPSLNRKEECSHFNLVV